MERPSGWGVAAEAFSSLLHSLSRSPSGTNLQKLRLLRKRHKKWRPHLGTGTGEQGFTATGTVLRWLSVGWSVGWLVLLLALGLKVFLLQRMPPLVRSLTTEPVNTGGEQTGRGIPRVAEEPSSLSRDSWRQSSAPTRAWHPLFCCLCPGSRAEVD